MNLPPLEKVRPFFRFFKKNFSDDWNGRRSEEEHVKNQQAQKVLIRTILCTFVQVDSTHLQISTNRMGDDEIIKGILANDPEAYRQLREILLPIVRKLMDAKAHHEDVLDVLDWAVEVFYGKIRKPGFELSSKLSTFLHGICQRVIWNRGTKKTSTHERTSDDVAKYSKEQVLLETNFDDVGKEALLNVAMMRLDEACRKLLEAYYLDELPRKKIASELGYTETHASHKKMDCLKKLKPLIMSLPGYKDLFDD